LVAARRNRCQQDRLVVAVVAGAAARNAWPSLLMRADGGLRIISGVTW
jgi:hypothetical protein